MATMSQETPRKDPSNVELASPLDPFLERLLTSIQRGNALLSPLAAARHLAAEMDVDRSFVEALLASARAREFLRAEPVPGSRGATRLRISKRGVAWLALRPES